MSLDDRLNPNDGSFIDTVDNYLFNFNKKIAEKFQNKTRRRKDILEGGLYLTSSLGFIGATSCSIMRAGYILASMTILPSVLAGICYLYPNSRPKSRLEEEIRCETLKLPKKIHKIFDILVYSLSPSIIISGINSGIYGYFTNQNQQYYDALYSLAIGIAGLTWKTGDYIARSDIGDPPKKEKKSIIEKIKESIYQLIPKPAYNI